MSAEDTVDKLMSLPGTEEASESDIEEESESDMVLGVYKACSFPPS